MYSCKECRNRGIKCNDCLTANEPNAIPSEFKPRQSIDECTVEQWNDANPGAVIEVDNVQKFIEDQKTKAECPEFKFCKEFIKEIIDYLETRPYGEVKYIMRELEFAYVQMK